MLTETMLYVIRPNFITNFWNKFLINEHHLVELEKDYDYLIMGNSIQKTGINPSKINGDILNLGLPGSKPMGMYILLKRYLKSHKAPKAVFFFVDPEDPLDSIMVVLRYFITVPEFISLWGDLTWRERGYFLLRYWVSFDTRRMKGMEIGGDKYKGGNTAFVREMRKNQGFMPSPKSDLTLGPGYFKNTGDRMLKEVVMTDMDYKYLDKFMALAKSHDIKVVFLGMFVPEELLYIISLTGFAKEYDDFFDYLKERYPGTYFMKKPIAYMGNEGFGDKAHLNEEGSKIYTEYFKKHAYLPIVEVLEDEAM